VQEVAVELDLPEQAPVAEALAAEGFAAEGSALRARIVKARESTLEEVGALVGWVLGGGILVICGGTGPILAALHLTPVAGPVAGPVVPAPGAPPIDLAEAWPVTGVGYCLYRAGEACVALAGRRGDGWVAYLGAPEPRLVAACLAWIRGRGAS
jgi:hypothetical protein